MKNFFIFIVVSVLFLPPVASAEDKKWSDVAELSYVDTGGNTDVKSALFNNILKYTFSKKTLTTWKLGILYGEMDGERTAGKYSTSGRVDYKITPVYYTYGEISWLKDTFSGIDERYRYSVGLGYEILTGPKHKLATEAGLNYTTEEYTDNTDNDYIGGRLFANYAYHFTEKNYFGQWVEYLHDFDDSDNYQVNAETSLLSALNGFLSMKTSYLIEHDAEPVPGNKKTDTKLAVTLVVNF